MSNSGAPSKSLNVSLGGTNSSTGPSLQKVLGAKSKVEKMQLQLKGLGQGTQI